MKKLLILFLALTFVGGLAFGGPLNITLDATSTLKWKITGVLMSNQTFGLVPQFIQSPSTGQTADFELAPAEIALGLDVKDGETSIVKAESLIAMDGQDLTFVEDSYADAFHYIEFPNVIPGMLGVLLHKSGTLSTDVTSKASVTSVPNVLVTVVPVKDATVKVGLAYATGVLHETYDADVAVTTSTVDSTEIGTYMDFAASLYASYKLALSDKDSVTFALGTVFDTAYSAGVVIASKIPVANTLYTQDAYKAYKVADPVVNIEDKLGWATLPVGVKVGLVMGDLTANVAAKLRLVQGKDALNMDDAAVPAPRAWEMPLYAKVDVTYKLVAGDMTITPTANFQYSNDFWKWWWNADPDVEAWEYKGEVSGAEFVGRPMSLGVSVPVVGIAKMVDVTVFGSAGLGDGNYAHGAYGTTAGMATQTLAEYIDVVNNAATNVVADAMAYKLGLTVSAKPIAEVMVKNEFTYNHDGLGIVGQSSGTRWGSYLNRIKDVVTAEYYMKVADATAATFYGIVTFQTDTYAAEKTTQIVDYDVPSDTAKGNAAKTTLGYELGVKVSVKY